MSVAACSGQPQITVDATPPVPFTYQLDVVTYGQPERPDPPAVYIDGAPTTSISIMYGRAADAEGTMHVVELRYADQVIATRSVTVHSASTFCAPGPLARQSEEVAELETGDLRMGALFERAADGNECHGDPALVPECPCTSDERCAVRVVRTAPTFTHLRCTAIGPKQLGDACTFTPDPDGAYDDCGDGLICYAGTCHGPCDINCTTSCAQPDGYDTWETFCM